MKSLVLEASGGESILGGARSMADLASGRVISGGSTLTMQVALCLILTPKHLAAKFASSGARATGVASV